MRRRGVGRKGERTDMWMGMDEIHQRRVLHPLHQCLAVGRAEEQDRRLQISMFLVVHQICLVLSEEIEGGAKVP